MTKSDPLCSLIPILVALTLPGCKGHSIVDFKNPEIPSGQQLNEVSQETKKRYSVDGVFIVPSIPHRQGKTKDSGYAMRIDAFSPEMVDVEIKKLSLTLDGKSIAFESPFSDRLMDDFSYNDDDQAYYAYISSPPFNIKAPAKTKELHVILTVEVKKGDKAMESGTVEATFKPRKRTYYSPRA